LFVPKQTKNKSKQILKQVLNVPTLSMASVPLFFDWSLPHLSTSQNESIKTQELNRLAIWNSIEFGLPYFPHKAGVSLCSQVSGLVFAI